MIVDASVAAKWFAVDEVDADRAALVTTRRLAAPDLIIPELTNALWAKRRRGEFNGPIRPDRLRTLITDLVPTLDLAEHALALAVKLDHPAYDCFYLALALQRRSTLVTADTRFADACARGGHAATTILLAEWTP